MRIRVAEENWLCLKGSRNGYRYRNMFPYSRCCICVSGDFLLDTNRFKVEYSWTFEECLFTRVLYTERVQMIKESFWDLIYVPRIDIFSRSLHVVKSRSKLNVLLKKLSQFGQRKDWETALLLFTYHLWLLYLSNRAVLSYFCTSRLANSPLMFPSTKSISYRRMLRVSRSSTIGISFMWTLWIWLVLSPPILLMNNLNHSVVSSSSRWVPCKWRASAQKRHKLLLYDCLVFSSYLGQLIVWFLSRGSGKTAFLHPIRTSLSKAANTVKFVNL